MPEQPADPLHYEMKIPPKKLAPDAGNDPDQPRTEDPQADSATKEEDAGGSQATPHTKRP